MFDGSSTGFPLWLLWLILVTLVFAYLPLWDLWAHYHIAGNPSLISNLSTPKTPRHITRANGSKEKATGVAKEIFIFSISVSKLGYIYLDALLF